MKRFFSSFSAALSVLFVVISVMPVSAATTSQSSATTADAYDSASLSIDPRKNYIINPGQTVTDKLIVGNLDPASGLSLTLRMIDFSFTDQSGTPKLYLAANAPQTSWSLKPYTTLPKNVQIGPGETKTLNYSITIPKNLGAGSYYSAILYESGTGTGANIGLGASGVTLVTVPGTVNENMSLQKFGAYSSDDSGVTGSYVYFATTTPQMIAYVLKNSGDVAEAPAGSITLKNMFGKTVNSINKTNVNQDLALIGQTRLFATCIQSQQSEIIKLGGTVSSANEGNTCVTPHLTPGLYTANLDVFYGQNGNETHEITGVAHFWYLPLWFIAIVLAILAVIIFAAWWLQRKVRTLVKGTTYRSGSGISRKH
jgi:hypothetical protein